MVNSFIDNDCRENTTYYYALQSVDYSQNRSAKSEPVEAAVTGAKGLIAHYDFEGTASDLTDNGLDCAVAGVSKYVPGRFGKSALMLDGASNYVRIPASAANLSETTVAVWVYSPSTIAADSRLFHFGADNTRYAALSLNQAGEIVLTLKNGEEEQKVSAGAFPEGWHHLALAIGQNATTIYIDGEAKGVAASVTASVTSSVSSTGV